MVAHGPPTATLRPLDKLWTNTRLGQTLDKVWIPLIVSHGPPAAHFLPGAGPVNAYSSPSPCPEQSLSNGQRVAVGGPSATTNEIQTLSRVCPRPMFV